jgi:vitamin-K-epoxide reductase (warfarin-sensitive)
VQSVVTNSADNLNNESSNQKSRDLGKTVKCIFWTIAILSVAGMTVSAVSLQRHYAKSATSYCDFGEKFNCDIVNRSEYSEVIGIPVAGVGVVGYGVLLVLSTFYRSRPETALRLLVAATAGLVFALYLTYVEGYVLMTWCVLCLTSLALIFSISLLAGAARLLAARAS